MSGPAVEKQQQQIVKMRDDFTKDKKQADKKCFIHVTYLQILRIPCPAG